MNAKDFTAYGLNKELAASMTAPLNFCRVVELALERNLSVVAQYHPHIGSNDFAVLGPDLIPALSQKDDAYYYGISPLLDSALIIDCISRMEFCGHGGIDRFIRENASYFMLHTDQAPYLLDFARYAVVTLAGLYGLKIRRCDALLQLQKKYDPQSYMIEEKEDFIFIKGCLTDEVMQALSSLRFLPDTEDRCYRCTSKEGYTVRELFSDSGNVQLTVGDVFYSGVLLKPQQLVHLPNHYENHRMDMLQFVFERSTYATVYALDHDLTGHPALDPGSRERMKAFFRHDDQVKKTLAESPIDPNAYSDSTLQTVNRYLKDSYNVNQIGVSANIVTKDGILLLTQRSQNAIDSGFLYPGANGNAEVLDHRVSFYRYSAYADAPTIDLNAMRIDFSSEIERETYAELGLGVREEKWACYGVVLTGNTAAGQQDAQSKPSRRMHFNIIFEQRVDETFSEICYRRQNAIEAFENERLLGFRLKLFKTWADRLKSGIGAVIETLVSSKDIVESFLLVALLVTQRESVFSEGWSSVVSAVLAVLITFATLVKLFRSLKEHIRQRRIVIPLTILYSCSYRTIEQKLSLLRRRKRFHPAAYAALRFYIENALYDSYIFHQN